MLADVDIDELRAIDEEDRLEQALYDEENGFLYADEGGQACVLGCKRHCSNLSIPTTIAGLPVTSIGESAFREARWLRSVVIPEGVTSIGIFAFRHCIRLESVKFPQSLRELNNACFERNPKLAMIDLPDDLESIGPSAFRNCTALQWVCLPQKLWHIDQGSFSGCSSLSSIELPESLHSVGSWAFSNCESLAEISIPSSVESLGTGAFFACKWLIDVRLSEGLETIGDRCFCSCLSLKHIDIPESVWHVGQWAFSDCRSMQMLIMPHAISSFERWLGGTPAHCLLFTETVPLEAMETHPYKTAAACGFIARKRDGFSYSASFEEKYYAFIRQDCKAVCEQCDFDGELIWWLVNNEIIGVEELDTLIALAAKRGRIEATAVLLECSKHLGGLDESDRLSLEL